MADETENIFKVFDKDFDGKLKALEMHQALGAAGLCPSIEAVQLAVKEAGEAGGDIEVFRRLLQQFQSSKPTAETLKQQFKVPS
ncbi:calmodulin, putative [Eimeria tenella]|uniref:Calmodulin, putative n=1 Tax=Eimeria tenella TaxID=5802 RepID=U6KX63_EIMTE|nr:calmodulin, putative [Eimeria tenella]CDJ42747.1 calmodulin, putative [Eimeria tenella]|eukprot:XP_013233497.1 calmodulin, putative [Eimeria tenella]